MINIFFYSDYLTYTVYENKVQHKYYLQILMINLNILDFRFQEQIITCKCDQITIHINWPSVICCGV